MTVFGDGFLAYHFDVHVAAGAMAQVKETLKGRERRFREEGTWPGFPRTLVEEVSRIPGVTGVEEEGPQSSILIPLRMVQGMAGIPCTLSTVVGTGPMADAVAHRLAEWDVRLSPSKQLEDVDSPVELTLREPSGAHASVRLYPAPRSRYRAKLSLPEPLPDHLVLNRVNEGLLALARRVAEGGGTVSLRIREFGRYDTVADYLPLLGLARHLVLSTRHGVVRTLAREAGVDLPRQWPAGCESLTDEHGSRLVSWLRGRMSVGGIVVLNTLENQETAFFRDGHEPVTIAAPIAAGDASRAARLQGALLGMVLAEALDGSLLAGGNHWTDRCREVVGWAYRGTRCHPWVYPHEGQWPE